MVCLGNICRSPLGEGILKSKLPIEKFFIDSAGTASYHIGSPPDKRSIEIAKINSIDISGQRARAFKINDFIISSGFKMKDWSKTKFDLKGIDDLSEDFEYFQSENIFLAKFVIDFFI